MTQDWISIGLVRSVNPARRMVRIVPEAGHAYEFESLEWLRIAVAGSAGSPMRCRIDDIEFMPDGIVAVRLVPGVTRDAISRCKGREVLLAPAELHEAPAGEIGMGNGLLGFSAMDESGALLGVVVDQIETGYNGAAVIEKPDGGTLALPLIEQVVVAVDLENARLLVRDIAGYAVEEAAPDTGMDGL